MRRPWPPGRRRAVRTVVVVAVLALAALLAATGGWPLRHATGAASGTAAPSRTVVDDPHPSGSATPSATGSASPTPSPAGPLRVVGLGDSVPAADTCGCDGFLELATASIADATGRRTVLANDAVSGWTASDVLTDLTSGHSAADVRAGADLVVVEAGANDLDLSQLGRSACATAVDSCFGSTLDAVRSSLTATVARVHAVDAVADVRVLLLGYWNVGLDGAVGRAQGSTYVVTSDALTRALDQVVEDVAAATGSTYVDAYTPLKGSGDRDPTGDLLADGDHPNAAGHQRLAAAVLTALRASGAVAAWRAA